ncbi:hypothetical protein GCM10012275_26490 [Longimycelium tulufanense]|uniref:Uncharacterized protein n=1 Tax=Longimycelium tulufanense TaxID=907463 RepID=A0A8J3CFR8_9PSEU|nr:hypothetical protein [Longimycelium tulufanense]GGM54074.1 hypothetical protein GCM10012275_26490 [Longimycelium tulufanense]
MSRAREQLSGEEPVVRWDPLRGRLELCFTEVPCVHRTDVAFTSPVWLDFAEDELLSVDLLDIPDLLGDLVAARGAGTPRIACDSGWLWMELRKGGLTTRRTGLAEVEFTLDGARLVSIRLQLDEEPVPGAS